MWLHKASLNHTYRKSKFHWTIPPAQAQDRESRDCFVSKIWVTNDDGLYYKMEGENAGMPGTLEYWNPEHKITKTRTAWKIN